MASDYKAMKYEYDLHKSIREKHNGVKWLSGFMTNICYGIELANKELNPFEFKLKGWSEQINDDIDDYYDVLGELYEKYFKNGKSMPPELKLMGMIGFSAVQFHLTHTYLGSTPSLKDTLNRDPNLAKQLHDQNAAEKVKKQYEKHRETMEKKVDEQHNMAHTKAADLQKLKEQNDEYQRQLHRQQLMEKELQVKELQRQLLQQKSESRSMYSSNRGSYLNKPPQNQEPPAQQTMVAPPLPASLRNKQQFQYNNATNIGVGAMITPDQIINDNYSKGSEDNASRDSSKKSTASRRGKGKKPVIKIQTK
jgi:hypothetical protein